MEKAECRHFEDVDGNTPSRGMAQAPETIVIAAATGAAGGQVGQQGSRTGAATDPYIYPMNHEARGHFIIVNNKNFHASTRMNVRTGTNVDAEQLKSLFSELGFKVNLQQDQTRAEMLQLIIQAAGDNHANCDCFGMAVLSHGDDNGILYGIDGPTSVDNLVAPLKTCESLRGKPKIFIVQACRGTKLDEGGKVVADGEMETDDRSTKNVYRIPLEADFLYAYSTVSGYYSWRNQLKGSWFIQALYEMMTQYMNSLDLVRILTRVSHNVAYKFESESEEQWMSRKKQVPSIVSMLTRDLYIMPKVPRK